MKRKLDDAYNLINQAEINELFSQVTLQEVEQFYKTYQLWLKHQEIAQVQQKINKLREKQNQNTARMNDVAPSAVSLSTLAQLRASGVEDLDLLDRMLERGEEWLDHTMELLERCEDLNVIRGNYTQWCEHALEGAYEWMGSMDDASLHDYFHAEAESEDITPQALVDFDPDPTEIVTEDQLLRKLMSEDGTSTKKITVPLPKITQDLPPLAIHEDVLQELSPVALHEDVLATHTVANDQDFPVEIEEPEAEISEINAEELKRISAELQRYHSQTQASEPDEHLEDLFPVEIADPTLSTEEIIERSQLLPVEAIDDSIEITPSEVHESAAATEPGTSELVETPEAVATDEPIDAVETVDEPSEDLAEPAEVLASVQPVNVAEPQPEAIQTEIDIDVLASEESEAVDNLSTNSSTVADIPTDLPTEQASSEIDTEAMLDDTQTYPILEPPLTESEEETFSKSALSQSTEIDETEAPTSEIETTSSTSEEMASSESLEASEPMAVDKLTETESPLEITENDLENTQVDAQESAPVAELDTPTLTTDNEAHVATDTETQDTETQATADIDVNGEEKPATQWPFVYQEIEDTQLPLATSADTAAPASTDKKNPAATKQTKKKPQKEASRKMVKKKSGFIRRLLARLFGR